MNILITGKPGTGKTTLIKKVIGKIALPKRGFYTEEIRENGRRTGFSLKTLDGKEAVLASVYIKSPYRVGKYGVDLETFAQIGVAQLKEAIENDVLIVIDEIGKMELFSAAFREIVERAMDTGRVIAAIRSGKDDFIGKIKRRKDVRIVTVTPQNRDSLKEDILGMIGTNSDSRHRTPDHRS